MNRPKPTRTETLLLIHRLRGVIEEYERIEKEAVDWGDPLPTQGAVISVRLLVEVLWVLEGL